MNILICYHSATRHEISETNWKNMPTLDLKKLRFFSLHLFDLLIFGLLDQPDHTISQGS